MSRRVEPCGLMALPSEVLVMVLARAPLLDLYNIRLVCRRLKQMVDGLGGKKLWATVSLEGLAVNPQHQGLIERAAGCGNREALIKLALAFLYNQGVPKGMGAGTLESWNGIRALEYLCQLDSLDTRPLSWLLIRPPWSSAVCNKVCAYNKMIEKCVDKQTEAIPGLFYSLGQTVNFLKADGKEPEEGQMALDWFQRGSNHSCSFSALQVWRHTHKPNLATREIQVLRSLRKIVAMSNDCSSLDAKLELCTAYAGGRYGSVGRHGAFSVICGLMATSRPVLSAKIYRVQRDITNIMRYITVDWMVEIAELKSLSPHTLHQAVALFDSYLLARQVDRSALQLLGVTAILVASRWSGVTMLTIRESSWLTENTYSYEEVVQMMAELLGAFRGDIRKLTICDYLDILLTLCGANNSVQSMAYYLSEAVLLHPDFGRFSSAHLAAACLLNAHILLKQDYPWPGFMEQATGFSLSSLCRSCVMIYRRCLTKEFAVADHRGVELCAITSRYSHPSRQCISKHEIMSLDEFSRQLGVSSESVDHLSTPKPKSKVKDKLLSFLSDSCYLSSPLWLSGSDSESESESEYDEAERKCNDSTDGIGSGCVSLQSSSSTSFCSMPNSTSNYASPTSSPRVSLQQRSFPPLSLPFSPPLSSHSSPLHLSTSAHQLQPIAMTTNLSHTQSLSAPLVPAVHFNEDCANNMAMPSSLTRHPSWNSCDLPTCSGLSEKTDSVHISCPDFHSCSTDMELGSTSQEESNEMDTHNSSSSESPAARKFGSEILCPGGHSMGDCMVLDFNLPPLREPQFRNLNPLPPSCRSSGEHDNMPRQAKFINCNPLPPISTSTPQGNVSSAGAVVNQSQSLLFSKKPRAGGRNPLQPLHNTPSALNSRHSSTGTSQKGKQIYRASSVQGHANSADR